MPLYQFSVEVESAFLPEQSAPERGIYGFAYTITVSNTGDVAAQLISRHWFIRDGIDAGHQDERQVRGLGVVGQQPLLRPGEAFRYTSGCRLGNATGTMHGSFFCVAEDGERFEVDIPLFVLDADGGSTLSGESAQGTARVLH